MRRCAISLALSFLSTQKRDHHTQHDEVFSGIKHDQLNPEEVVKAKNASNNTMKTDLWDRFIQKVTEISENFSYFLYNSLSYIEGMIYTETG